MAQQIRLIFFLLLFILPGCNQTANSIPLEVPRGYVPVLEIVLEDGVFRFGPFVGYYFRPEDPSDFSHLKFVCFNEQHFYTLDLPANALLFEGEAILSTLPDLNVVLPQGEERIHPVFFSEAPEAWLESRPEPKAEFVHFHSCYNSRGPVRHGYWLRHVSVADFTYDMGGRVEKDSPLYHQVSQGADKNFGKIIEFDSGP
jgi:hypothetical protein